MGPSQKHHSGSVRAGLGNGPAAPIVPIPGTTQYPHLIENSGAPQVRLTDRELREIDAALAKIPLQGGRADPFTESQFDKS